MSPSKAFKTFEEITPKIFVVQLRATNETVLVQHTSDTPFYKIKSQLIPTRIVKVNLNYSLSQCPNVS